MQHAQLCLNLHCYNTVVLHTHGAALADDALGISIATEAIVWANCHAQYHKGRQNQILPAQCVLARELGPKDWRPAVGFTVLCHSNLPKCL
jgi:hypothetical protein